MIATGFEAVSCDSPIQQLNAGRLPGSLLQKLYHVDKDGATGSERLCRSSGSESRDSAPPHHTLREWQVPPDYREESEDDCEDTSDGDSEHTKSTALPHESPPAEHDILTSHEASHTSPSSSDDLSSYANESDEGHHSTSNKSMVRVRSSPRHRRTLLSRQPRRHYDLRSATSSKSGTVVASHIQITALKSSEKVDLARRLHDLLKDGPSRGLSNHRVRQLLHPIQLPRYPFHLLKTSGFDCYSYNKTSRHHQHILSQCDGGNIAQSPMRFPTGVLWNKEEICKVHKWKQEGLKYSEIATRINEEGNSNSLHTAVSVKNKWYKSVVSERMKDLLGAGPTLHSSFIEACNMLKSPTKDNIRDYLEDNYPEEWNTRTWSSLRNQKCCQVKEQGVCSHDQSQCRRKSNFRVGN